MKVIKTLALLTGLTTAQMSLAEPMSIVNLEPITHATAALVVVDPQGNETSYTPQELEQFSTLRLVTTTPWRTEAAEFDGILLSELLAEHGLEDSAIKVTAENDFSTVFSSELINTVNVLIATRVNGRAHSRRERGPIQFVIDEAEHGTSQLVSESHFVWMAARIERQ